MKIICVDSYGRESIADVLVAMNVSEYWGDRISCSLNDHAPLNEYFRCVEDDHVLWRGMEEFV
jgi:hypothetical protein